MAATNPIVKPTNRVIVHGDPAVYTYLIKTVANCYPKRLVTRDTTDAQIKACGATDVPVGILGFEQAPSPIQPATIDTIYVVDKDAPVIKPRSGDIYVLHLASGQNVTQGAMLVTAAAGEVTAAAALTGLCATGSATASAVDATRPTVAISGDYGVHVVVGYAEESVDASAGAADIMVRWK
jgi:hypothetical protein